MEPAQKMETEVEVKLWRRIYVVTYKRWVDRQLSPESAHAVAVGAADRAAAALNERIDT